MQATKKQIQIIAMNFQDKEAREEVVYSVTQDAKRTSTKQLTFDEANEVLKALGFHPFKQVKKFDSKNPKHRVIMNLCHELDWIFYDKGRQLADLDKLGEWLMTNKRSPVKKRTLCEMTPQELEKVIKALTNITKWTWEKK